MIGAPTSFEDSKALLDALTGGDDLMFALAVVFIASLLAYIALKHTKVSWYKLGAALGFYLVALLVIGIRLEQIWLVAAACVLLLLAAMVWLGNWADCKKKLERVAELADPMQPCCDDVAAFALIAGIRVKLLSSGQLAIFDRYCVFCHIALGNCGLAKNLLNEGVFEPAFKHFALGVIANGEGDYNQEKCELDAAFANAGQKSDPFVLLQLEHNQAVEHIDGGRYRTANDELEKLRLKVRRTGVRNKTFLNLLYENIVLNKTRLNASDGGAAEGWALIDEYAKTLDLDDGTDRGALFNMKLMFLRQLGAGRDEKAELFANEIAATLDGEGIPVEQRAVAMASLGRIAWADGLDPSRVLEYFGACDLDLKGLKPKDRVFVFKNLSILCETLATDDSCMIGINRIVSSYLESGMRQDLDAWERELPPEAIKQRALILRERAALCQLEGGGIERVAAYLEEAIALFEQGLLVMDALELRWGLAKCLVPVKPQDAKVLLFELEERLSSLGRQPFLGYPYYELSLCYGLLGMGSECRAAYSKAVSSETAMGHYAPPVRRDVVIAGFCARFYLMMEALDSPERLMPYLRTEEGRDWLGRYPKGMNVLSLSILLGRFLGLGLIPLERRMTDIGGGLALVTYWVTMPELRLVFDPSIKTADGRRGAVFLRDAHPLISQDSNFETLMQRRGFEALPVQIKLCDESELDVSDRVAVEDVLEALDIACKREHPSVAELLECYRDGCEDVSVEG